MIQTSIQIDTKTRESIAQLAEWWGLPATRNTTPVVMRSIETALQIEAARRTLTNADFVSFLAELHKPLTRS